jgi:hypothetical protein
VPGLHALLSLRGICERIFRADRDLEFRCFDGLVQALKLLDSGSRLGTGSAD